MSNFSNWDNVDSRARFFIKKDDLHELNFHCNLRNLFAVRWMQHLFVNDQNLLEGFKSKAESEFWLLFVEVAVSHLRSGRLSPSC